MSRGGDRSESPAGARPRRQRLRIFLAVFPSAAARDLAARVIESLRRPDDRVSWVKPENLHYTLRFLGQLGEDGSRRAAQGAAEAARDHNAFDAVLGSLGAFPGSRRARVLWAGLAEGATPLVALARSVEAALERRGFEREGRRFEAHLTIGRVREEGPDWTETLKRGSALIAASAAAARFRVDRVVTVHSQLSPKGSIYTVRDEALLVG